MGNPFRRDTTEGRRTLPRLREVGEDANDDDEEYTDVVLMQQDVRKHTLHVRARQSRWRPARGSRERIAIFHESSMEVHDFS